MAAKKTDAQSADSSDSTQAPEEVYELQLNPKRSSVSVEIDGTYYSGGELVPASEAEKLTARKDLEGRQYLTRKKVTS